jgi:hypothetical protein
MHIELFSHSFFYSVIYWIMCLRNEHCESEETYDEVEMIIKDDSQSNH